MCLEAVLTAVVNREAHFGSSAIPFSFASLSSPQTVETKKTPKERERKTSEDWQQLRPSSGFQT
jgi:hypothetical protein